MVEEGLTMDRLLTTGIIIMLGTWVLKSISFYAPFPFDGILYVTMNMALLMTVVKGIAPGLLEKIPP